MKRDLYAEVSARIVAELEAGAAPWVKPWSARRRLPGRVRFTNNDRWFFIQLYRWFPSIHLADKLAYFYHHGWSSATVLRFPSPIRSKSPTVPTDYGLRSDDCKCAIHLGKQSADASQYRATLR
jgi:hypothetical protein